jgi:prefoldin subunit 5
MLFVFDRLKEQEIGQLVRSSAAAEVDKQDAERALEETKNKLGSQIQRLKAQLTDIDHAARYYKPFLPQLPAA